MVYTDTATGTTAGVVWTNWVTGNITISSGTMTAATTEPINAAITTATTNIINQQVLVWGRWNEDAVLRNAAAGLQRQLQHHTNARVSEEERARRAAEEERWKKAYEEENRLRLEAERKAKILLESVLDKQQREDLKNKRCFFLYSKGKKYRIDWGTHGNVKRVTEKNEVVESFCIQPDGVPVADSMVAQELMLEANPEEFRRIANVTPIRRDLLAAGM